MAWMQDQNGEASQTSYAFFLAQMFKKVGNPQEKVEASPHVATAFL